MVCGGRDAAVLSIIIIIIILPTRQVWSHEEWQTPLVTVHYYFWYAL